MTNGGPNSEKNTPFAPEKPGMGGLFLKFAIPLVVLIALCTAALQVVKWRLNPASSAPLGVATLNVGSTLRDFPLKRLDGGPTRASQLGARVILLNFWATWCEACMLEMPSIIKLQAEYQNRGLKVAAVDLDDEPIAVAPKTAKRLGFNFPVYTDMDGTLSGFFDIHAIPLTVVMNQDLKILMVENGERNWAATEFRDLLDQWLKQ